MINLAEPTTNDTGNTGRTGVPSATTAEFDKFQSDAVLSTTNNL